MSYATVLTGFHARFLTVAGLKIILEHEPTAIQDSPLIYSLLDGFERQIDDVEEYVTVTYRTLHRLLVRWQDNKQAEADFVALINVIPASIESDPRLSNSVESARIVVGDAGFTTVGGTEYRSCDFYSEVIEVGAIGTL